MSPQRRRLSVLLLAGFVFGLIAGKVYGIVHPPPKPYVRPPFKPRTVTINPRPIASSELGAFRPLPQRFATERHIPTAERVALGRQFFFDKRFSRGHDVACNSCHPLDRYGMDGRGVSLGYLGQEGRRNAPTVYNAAGHNVQFWDGRARDVEQQAGMPVLDPFEMAMDEERVLRTLRSIPEYVSALGEAFPHSEQPVSYDNFRRAIGAFERRLVTPSRWDRFVDGDELALTEKEQRGFAIFFRVGCPNCHSGAFIGGMHMEQLGQAKPWPNQTDLGRSSGPKAPPIFKVASLRNVAETAPYFHDASSTTLADAVQRMALHQLGVVLTEEQTDALTAWLGSLTGDLPRHLIAEPELPPSTPSTPQPTTNGY